MKITLSSIVLIVFDIHSLLISGKKIGQTKFFFRSPGCTKLRFHNFSPVTLDVESIKITSRSTALTVIDAGKICQTKLVFSGFLLHKILVL